MEEERELLKCEMELKKVILICINTQNSLKNYNLWQVLQLHSNNDGEYMTTDHWRNDIERGQSKS